MLYAPTFVGARCSKNVRPYCDGNFDHDAERWMAKVYVEGFALVVILRAIFDQTIPNCVFIWCAARWRGIAQGRQSDVVRQASARSRPGRWVRSVLKTD